jgi:hypothetical protein
MRKLSIKCKTGKRHVDMWFSSETEGAFQRTQLDANTSEQYNL